MGLLDLELNSLTKALFTAMVVLSVVMLALEGLVRPWFRNLFRFILLFSYVIPISLRVNLDMGKAVYRRMIMKNENIPGTVVRTSTIPEELGRLVYLSTDKTGDQPVQWMQSQFHKSRKSQPTAPKVRKSVSSRIHEAVKAIALCHNVTPVYESRAGVNGETERQTRISVTRTGPIKPPAQMRWLWCSGQRVSA